MISVIIPSICRESLWGCLASIYSQKEAPVFEVIVVVKDIYSCCFDRLTELEYPNLRILEYNSNGNGPAKNYGVANAKYDYIAFTDDDCVVAEDWLKRLWDGVYYTRSTLIVGNCVAYDTSNPYQLAHQSHIQYFLSTNLSKASVGTTMNMLIAKKLFSKLGGFNAQFATHYGDDRDFNQRWKDEYSIHPIYACSAIVKHNHPFTFKKFFKLSFRYGMGVQHCRFIAKKECREQPDFPSRKLYSDLFNAPYLFYPEVGFWRTFYAGCLVIASQEVKRIGALYACRYPEVASKVYD